MKSNLHKYFFVLGNNPALSIAELSVIFRLDEGNEPASRGFYRKGSARCRYANHILIMEIGEKINAQELIKKIGGTIKIGEIVAETKDQQTENLLKIIKPVLIPKNGKYKFGISYYGQNKFNSKPLGMEIKKYLREKAISCRWVTSREKTLSSVVVEQNKLTARGIEIILIEDKKSEDRPRIPEVGPRIFIGRTLAVQPFKELSFRDYGRPARDDRSGMLPPKLAQIMINLASIPAGEDVSILDPFCGSGTILTEAMLMGYKNLFGADISEKAVLDSKKNINWVSKKFQISPVKRAQANFKLQISRSNAISLSKNIKSNFIDAIVTEPYLGPQRGHIDIKKTIKELENLYSNALAGFKKILKPDRRIVMVWPIFRVTRKSQHITPNINGLNIINPVPKYLRGRKNIKLTGRNTIIYGRPGQRVWREIVILRPE